MGFRCYDVQAPLGHESFATTQRYAHLFAKDRASVLDAMNQAVSRLYAYESQDPTAAA